MWYLILKGHPSKKKEKRMGPARALFASLSAGWANSVTPDVGTWKWYNMHLVARDPKFKTTLGPKGPTCKGQLVDLKVDGQTQGFPILLPPGSLGNWKRVNGCILVLQLHPPYSVEGPFKASARERMVK